MEKEVFNDNFTTQDLELKKSLLSKHHIALFDVIKSFPVSPEKPDKYLILFKFDTINAFNSKLSNSFINVPILILSSLTRTKRFA